MSVEPLCNLHFVSKSLQKLFQVLIHLKTHINNSPVLLLQLRF